MAVPDVVNLSVQLMLVDLKQEPRSILLGTHSEQGLFPGRMTGIARVLNEVEPTARKDMMHDMDALKAKLLEACSGHGLGAVLHSDDLVPCARVECVEADGDFTVETVFHCSKPGLVRATEQAMANEGRALLVATADFDPCWERLDRIPYQRMPVDDAVWYPPVLAGSRRVNGRFCFDGKDVVASALWESDLCTHSLAVASTTCYKSGHGSLNR